MYFTLLFLVIKLLALYSIKYGLNYLSTYPIKNSPAYTTWSTTICYGPYKQDLTNTKRGLVLVKN